MKNYFLSILLSICVILCSCTKEQAPLKNDQIPTSKDADHEIVKLNSGILLSKRDTNYYLQGDIRLTKKQLEILNTPQTKSAYTSNFVTYWPNAIVYYEISPSVTPAARDSINAAFMEYETKTPIRFWPKTATINNYIEFVYNSSVNECRSNVGMIGGQQELLLGNDFKIHHVIHEIGHSIGLFHEHCRTDRGNYVQINWGNIKSGSEHNFQIDPYTSDYGYYDFNSIMHYSSNTMASNYSYNTIYDLSDFYRTWDDNKYLSNGDAEGIYYMYGGPYKGRYSEQIYDHPDAFFISDYYTEEWKGFNDIYIVFYSDSNLQNECVLQKPRLVNYTLNDEGEFGYSATNYQIVVPAGVSRAYLGETYLHYKEVQSVSEFRYQSWIIIH
jgi:hypothetical protein